MQAEIYEIAQGTDQWMRLRAGKPTASNFHHFIQPSTGKLRFGDDGKNLSDGALSYMDWLIAQRWVEADMRGQGGKFEPTERGHRLEPEARAVFSEQLGAEVSQVGVCIDHQYHVACSPDGLIMGDDGEYVCGVEFKCPYAHTHVGYVREGRVPQQYLTQVHGSMVVTGLRAWWFYSYYPGLQPLCLCVQWNEYTDRVQDAVHRFAGIYRGTCGIMDSRLRVDDADTEKASQLGADVDTVPTDGEASYDASRQMEEASVRPEIQELLRRATAECFG